MKTLIPEPAIPRSQLLATSQGVFGALFTESQLRSAMVAAYNEAIEDAAKVCKGMTCYTYEQGTSERRAWNEATIEAGHYLTAMLKEQA